MGVGSFFNWNLITIHILAEREGEECASNVYVNDLIRAVRWVVKEMCMHNYSSRGDVHDKRSRCSKV